MPPEASTIVLSRPGGVSDRSFVRRIDQGPGLSQAGAFPSVAASPRRLLGLLSGPGNCLRRPVAKLDRVLQVGAILPGTLLRRFHHGSRHGDTSP